MYEWAPLHPDRWQEIRFLWRVNLDRRALRHPAQADAETHPPMTVSSSELSLEQQSVDRSSVQLVLPIFKITHCEQPLPLLLLYYCSK